MPEKSHVASGRFRSIRVAAGLVGAISLFVQPAASSAVTLSQDGRGQVLLFPYYAARDGFDTLVSIVNTKPVPKAIKVSFYEGKRGEAIFRFNLYLSAYDMWTAAITASPNGGARLITHDHSCTNPTLRTASPAFPVINDFAPLTPAYGNDGEATDAERTNEGHLEVVEMGEIANATIPSNLPGASTTTFDVAITHISDDPANCPAVIAATSAGGALLQPGVVGNGLLPPTGGLTGGASLINVMEGVDYSYDAVALAGLRNAPMHTAPAVEAPSLGDAGPRESAVMDGAGVVVRSAWNAAGGNPADPVTAVLMTNAVVNEFVLDSAINAATDWILSLPTRRYYVRPSGASRPFSKAFGQGGACELTYDLHHDREERSSESQGTISLPLDFRFLPLCWSDNVATFNNGYTLGRSALSVQPGFASAFAAGVASLRITDPTLSQAIPPPDTSARRIVDDAGRAYVGWPVVGFAVQRYVNGNVGGVRSNYGGNFVHNYERVIE